MPSNKPPLRARLAKAAGSLVPSLKPLRVLALVVGGWCAVTAGIATSWRTWAISLGLLAVLIGLLDLWRLSAERTRP